MATEHLVSHNPSTRSFVVQKHRARTLHYDFRLEKDGVLKSWAVPKGLPDKTGIRRLAIRVDDHDLEFGEFEGEIAAGEYGAGQIEIWDRGEYEPAEWSADSITVTLHGNRISGTYTLIRFERGGPREWLVFRRSSRGGESAP